MLRSKLLAWAAFALVTVLICLTFSMRTAWWCFFDIFFAFMMVFCHLLALYIGRMSPAASRKLDVASLVFLILALIAFIVEWCLM